MIWNIIMILIILYVIYSLSSIKYQLKFISKHLNVKEEDKKISNEEIEKQLGEDLNQN